MDEALQLALFAGAILSPWASWFFVCPNKRCCRMEQSLSPPPSQQKDGE